jgi:hypothetical protein
MNKKMLLALLPFIAFGIGFLLWSMSNPSEITRKQSALNPIGSQNRVLSKLSTGF